MIQNPALASAHAGDVPWAAKIPDDEWNLYAPVVAEARDLGLPFAIGGGFAFSHYSRRWRNTKDLDFYIRSEDRQAFIDLLARHDFGDYFDTLAYDRSWIYRSHKPPVIIDIIWEMANHRTRAEMSWLTRGDEVQVRGERFRMIPAEELIWSKIYILPARPLRLGRLI